MQATRSEGNVFRSQQKEKSMVATPNTWGVVLLMAGVFAACILWATHGVTGRHDSEEQDLQAPGKSS
jgi:hypothetical protein